MMKQLRFLISSSMACCIRDSHFSSMFAVASSRMNEEGFSWSSGGSNERASSRKRGRCCQKDQPWLWYGNRHYHHGHHHAPRGETAITRVLVAHGSSCCDLGMTPDLKKISHSTLMTTPSLVNRNTGIQFVLGGWKAIATSSMRGCRRVRKAREADRLSS